MAGTKVEVARTVSTEVSPLHEEAVVRVNATADELFAYLNDPERLGAHMQKPSMMMMGGRMTYELDAGRGQAVDSRIKMSGRMLGLWLELEEVITELDEIAHRKVWSTTGTPRLFIIGRYRMGFDITRADAHSLLRVFIDYDIPKSRVGRILGRVVG